jgi:acyl-CoA dehydrogenase
MASLLTDEQEEIRRSAAQFARARLPIAHLRALRDADDPLGLDRARWHEMAERGFAGLIVPEAYGGAGLGFVELGLVLEVCGRTLAPTPLWSTAAVGASALLLGGTEAQRRARLPPLCTGETLLALAHEESSHHAPEQVAARAEPAGDGFRLRGDKPLVLDGSAADTLIVSARLDERIRLFLVDARAPGVTVERRRLVDSRGAARVGLDGAPAELLGERDAAAPLAALFDRAAVALAAEMLGGIVEAFERTVEYLKVRKQFGVPIGSFQALKHRAAHLFCEVELTRAIVSDALRAVDAARDDLPLLASAAKARASDVFRLVANEAVQLHGGVGVTDELDIGFYLKRAAVAEVTLGDAAHHRDRFARLKGY